MRAKSILIIANYPPPHGGVPRHIEYLVSHLSKKGWHVHVLSGGRSGIKHKNGIIIYKYNRIRKAIILLKSLLRFKLLGALKLSSIFKESPRTWLSHLVRISIGEEIISKNNIDIISAYNLYSGCPAGAVLSQKFNIPLVVNNLGEIYEMKGLFEKNLEALKYICSAASKFLSLTEHCAKSYKILGVPIEAEVIQYGIDIQSLSPLNEGAKIRNKLKIGNDSKIILFVGRMITEMGLDTLLKAIPSVVSTDNKIKFIIVGQSGKLLPETIILSEKYINNVYIAPNVPLDELPLYYAASTIVVVPTKSDRACGSLASIEAMATGKPVIASKVGGIPEIIADGETGILIPPDNVDALKETMLKLIRNDLLTRQMGEHGRLRAEKLFNKDKTNEEIEHILDQLTEHTHK